MPIPNYGYRVAFSDEDQAYVATCMEIEGLSGLGATAEAALAELRVAIELAIDEFSETGVRIPDRARTASHSGQFRLRLPKSVHAQLVARAENEGVSLNALVASYVAAGLGETQANDHAYKAMLAAIGEIRTAVDRQPLFAAESSREARRKSTR